MSKPKKKLGPLNEEEKALLEKYLPLIWWEVRRNNPKDEHQAAEWVQEGVFGAVKAIRGHNPEKGKLSTLIVKAVRYAIYTFNQMYGGVISLPRELITKETKEYAKRTRRVARCWREDDIANRNFYYDNRKENRSYLLAGGFWKDENIEFALSRLRGGDKELIDERFFQGKSLKEMGDVTGVSPQAVAKKVNRAVGNFKREYCRLEGIEL